MIEDGTYGMYPERGNFRHSIARFFVKERTDTSITVLSKPLRIMQFIVVIMLFVFAIFTIAQRVLIMQREALMSLVTLAGIYMFFLAVDLISQVGSGTHSLHDMPMFIVVTLGVLLFGLFGWYSLMYFSDNPSFWALLASSAFCFVIALLFLIDTMMTLVYLRRKCDVCNRYCGGPRESMCAKNNPLDLPRDSTSRKAYQNKNVKTRIDSENEKLSKFPNPEKNEEKFFDRPERCTCRFKSMASDSMKICVSSCPELQHEAKQVRKVCNMCNRQMFDAPFYHKSKSTNTDKVQNCSLCPAVAQYLHTKDARSPCCKSCNCGSEISKKQNQSKAESVEVIHQPQNVDNQQTDKKFEKISSDKLHSEIQRFTQELQQSEKSTTDIDEKLSAVNHEERKESSPEHLLLDSFPEDISEEEKKEYLRELKERAHLQQKLKEEQEKQSPVFKKRRISIQRESSDSSDSATSQDKYPADKIRRRSSTRKSVEARSSPRASSTKAQTTKRTSASLGHKDLLSKGMFQEFNKDLDEESPDRTIKSTSNKPTKLNSTVSKKNAKPNNSIVNDHSPVSNKYNGSKRNPLNNDPTKRRVSLANVKYVNNEKLLLNQKFYNDSEKKSDIEKLSQLLQNDDENQQYSELKNESKKLLKKELSELQRGQQDSTMLAEYKVKMHSEWTDAFDPALLASTSKTAKTNMSDSASQITSDKEYQKSDENLETRKVSTILTLIAQMKQRAQPDCSESVDDEEIEELEEQKNLFLRSKENLIKNQSAEIGLDSTEHSDRFASIENNKKSKVEGETKEEQKERLSLTKKDVPNSINMIPEKDLKSKKTTKRKKSAKDPEDMKSPAKKSAKIIKQSPKREISDITKKNKSAIKLKEEKHELKKSPNNIKKKKRKNACSSEKEIESVIEQQGEGKKGKRKVSKKKALSVSTSVKSSDTKDVQIAKNSLIKSEDLPLYPQLLNTKRKSKSKVLSRRNKVEPTRDTSKEDKNFQMFEPLLRADMRIIHRNMCINQKTAERMLKGYLPYNQIQHSLNNGELQYFARNDICPACKREQFPMCSTSVQCFANQVSRQEQIFNNNWAFCLPSNVIHVTDSIIQAGRVTCIKRKESATSTSNDAHG